MVRDFDRNTNSKKRFVVRVPFSLLMVYTLSQCVYFSILTLNWLTHYVTVRTLFSARKWQVNTFFFCHLSLAWRERNTHFWPCTSVHRRSVQARYGSLLNACSSWWPLTSQSIYVFLWRKRHIRVAVLQKSSRTRRGCSVRGCCPLRTRRSFFDVQIRWSSTRRGALQHPYQCMILLMNCRIWKYLIIVVVGALRCGCGLAPPLPYLQSLLSRSSQDSLRTSSRCSSQSFSSRGEPPPDVRWCLGPWSKSVRSDTPRYEVLSNQVHDQDLILTQVTSRELAISLQHERTLELRNNVPHSCFLSTPTVCLRSCVNYCPSTESITQAFFQSIP